MSQIQFSFILFLFVILGSGCNRCKDQCVHGTCIQRTCSCDMWYAGDACDRSVLTQYNGAYAGEIRYSQLSEEVETQLTASATEADVMLAQGLGITLVFNDLARFDVEEQVFQGRLVVGEGEMLIDLLSIRLDPVQDDSLGAILIEARKR